MQLPLVKTLAITALTIISFRISAQTDKEIRPIVTDNFEKFKESITQLTNEMGAKKIVGLGEGTHGTSEFYHLRFWISRILIEDKGFRNVAFENDLSDVWLLNQKLATSDDLNTLMKSHIMSIWQNKETRAFLEWVREYNRNHNEKIKITGVDYPLLKPDVEMLLMLLDKVPDKSLITLVNKMSEAANLQDQAWQGVNDKAFKGDIRLVSAGSKKGYLVADSLEKQLLASNLSMELKSELLMAVINIKQGFAPFHNQAKAGDRDSLMADNASMMLKEPNDKLIIWAHNAHLGKTKIYGGAVGGMGGYLLKLFPKNYFALGTGTANGTFAGTKDRRPTNQNPMIVNKLEKPISGSWEALLSKKGLNFYFDTMKFNPEKKVMPLRFIGFGTTSGASTYQKLNLVDMFDAFLFLSETKASTPLN
ncbi:MAG: erythromycin esterase family protein [Pedobacter sp.]|nr:MAG: erythromycin esterase family protein [Pedobacter sp.]